MPLVHIDLVAGRSDEQLKAMMTDVTTALEKHIGVPRANVKVVVDEMQPDRFMDGGVLRSEK